MQRKIPRRFYPITGRHGQSASLLTVDHHHGTVRIGLQSDDMPQWNCTIEAVRNPCSGRFFASLDNFWDARMTQEAFDEARCV